MAVGMCQHLHLVEVDATYAWLPTSVTIQKMLGMSRRQQCELSRHSHVDSPLAVLVKHFHGSVLITDEGWSGKKVRTGMRMLHGTRERPTHRPLCSTPNTLTARPVAPSVRGTGEPLGIVSQNIGHPMLHATYLCIPEASDRTVPYLNQVSTRRLFCKKVPGGALNKEEEHPCPAMRQDCVLR